MPAISLATKEDLKEIRAIWEEQFTTDEPYLSIMFGEIMPLCSNYICKENNKTVSTLSLMPMVFIDSSKGLQLEGWYMFGVATLKEHWGKKLAAQTIEYAVSRKEEEGCSFIFERPAQQSLNEYYSKLGFTKHLQRIPYLFSTQTDTSSTRNTTDSVLKEIRLKFRKRFEWRNPNILDALIKLGELEYHNATYCKTPQKEVFISIRTNKKTPIETINNAFFCFPME